MLIKKSRKFHFIVNIKSFTKAGDQILADGNKNKKRDDTDTTITPQQKMRHFKNLTQTQLL